MCCWHQLPSGLSRRAGRSRGRNITIAHTYPWLIPIITRCWQFPSPCTNILLSKSKLKLESRAIVVGVAMTPRNLGGMYRCRPHSRRRKCTRQFFFREPEHGGPSEAGDCSHPPPKMATAENPLSRKATFDNVTGRGSLRFLACE